LRFLYLTRLILFVKWWYIWNFNTWTIL
jgi:hypothetical protein